LVGRRLQQTERLTTRKQFLNSQRVQTQRSLDHRDWHAYDLYTDQSPTCDGKPVSTDHDRQTYLRCGHSCVWL